MTKLPAITKEQLTYADDDLIYGVDVDDPTDDPTGSSFKTPYKSLRNEVLKTHVVTPQMFGAVGDGIANDSAAVQEAADTCNTLNASAIVQPVLYFPRATSYRCVSTIIVKENIHISMDSPILHDGTESSTGMVVGTNFSRNEGMRLKIRMLRNGISDWTDEGSTGIQIINAETCDIFVDLSTLRVTSGFTVGLQCLGSGNGFANSSVRLGHIGNNRIGVDLTSETVNGTHTGSSGELNVLTDTSQRLNVDDLVGETINNTTDGSTGTVTSNTATTITCSGGLSGGSENDWDNGDFYTIGMLGWCNNNEWYGGRFFMFTDTHPGTERYGFRLTGADTPVSNESLNTNIFFHPSIELRIDAIPILIVHGQKNTFIGCRDEGNSPVFAKVLHSEGIINHSNEIDIGRGDGTLVQQGNAAGNVLTLGNHRMPHMSAREVFDTGPMHDNAVYYDGSLVHVPNVHIVTSGTTRGTVANTNVTFDVSETCTFTNATNRVDNTAHTRVNGDRLFFVETGGLPAELSEGTLYYVINATTNDFQVSLTIDGAAVTFTDDGTPTNTYNSRNRYLTVGAFRSVGVRVDTTETKTFIITRDIQETVLGNEGRVKVKTFNADEKQLQNEETFTVDDPNDELVQADHTLVVDDRITFTTDGTLPNDLSTTDDFFVISINDTAAGRFRVSLTEGGSALTDLADGSGIHTYHLSYGYAAGSISAFRLFWNNTSGGVYWQGFDFGLDLSLKVRDVVTSIDISIGRGSEDAFIRRFKILTTERHKIPTTRTSYDGSRDQSLAKQAPTLGVYFGPGRVVWNQEPTLGEPTAWVLSVAGAPGIWDELSRSTAQPEIATVGSPALLSSGATSIDSSGGVVAATLGSGDYIGQMKTIVMVEASNSSTVTISLHVTSNPEVYTFAAVNETLLLSWTGAEWTTLYSTASPAGQA